MFFNDRIKSFLCIFLGFLIIGTSNHCAFEDLFITISNSIFGDSGSDLANSCAGGMCGHQDDDSSQSHEHGQSHQVLVVKVEKTSIDLSKIFFLLIPLLSLLIRVGGKATSSNQVIRKLFGAPPDQLRDFICSLSFAPQAPPLPV